MINDKFNEMYLKQNQAKNFEKNGNTEAALKAYLSVINEYTPNTDFPYERACHLLMQKARYEEARKLAAESLKKLKNEEISGKADFFAGILKKVEERSKPQSKMESKISSSFSISSDKKLVSLFLFLGLLGILISLPDKIWKFIFLIFTLISVFFFIEILNDLRKKLNIKLKSIILIFSIIISLIGFIRMPKADWRDFASFPSITDIQQSTDLDEKNHNLDSSKKSEISEVKITDSDLDNLKQLAKTEFELKKYNIKIQKNKIYLSVTVSEGTSLERGKLICESLLKNLNLIKGFENDSGDKLGELYKQYSVQVELLDLNSSKMAVGDTNKTTQKISWIH